MIQQRAYPFVALVVICSVGCAEKPEPQAAGSSQIIKQAPKQVSPADGSVFDHFPRHTVLSWTVVPAAKLYGVEIEYCIDDKCMGANRGGVQVEGNAYSFAFVGAQPGRWRVWAIDSAGEAGPRSRWSGFSYTH